MPETVERKIYLDKLARFTKSIEHRKYLLPAIEHGIIKCNSNAFWISTRLIGFI